VANKLRGAVKNGDVRNGSLADYWTDSSSMSASERKADVRTSENR